MWKSSPVNRYTLPSLSLLFMIVILESVPSVSNVTPKPLLRYLEVINPLNMSPLSLLGIK